MGTQLVIEQEVAAEPSAVYGAWTSAEELAHWWWPQIPDTTYHVDARADGSYEIRSEAAGIGVRGEFLELDAPRLIRLTWNWLDGGVSEAEEQVRVTLAPGLDRGGARSRGERFASASRRVLNAIQEG